jgi:hypothetical protein
MTMWMVRVASCQRQSRGRQPFALKVGAWQTLRFLTEVDAAVDDAVATNERGAVRVNIVAG